MQTSDEQKPVIRARALRARNLMAVAHAVQHIFAMSIPPLLVFIHADLHLSWTQLGTVVAVGHITGGLMQFMTGMFVDKFGVKRVLISGFSLLLTGLFLFSRSHTLPAMIACQILFGIGNSTFHPASFAEVSRATKHRGMGIGMALHNIGGNVGGAAAYSIAALLAVWLGWRDAILAMVSGGALLTLAFGLTYREMAAWEKETDQSGKAEDEAAVTRQKPAESTDTQKGNENASPLLQIWMPVLVVATAALMSGAFSRGFNTFLPSFLTTARGASGAVAGMLSTIMMLSGAGGSFLGGKLGDTLDRRRVVLASALVTAMFIMLLVQLPLQGLPLVLLLIAIGFSLSVARPCMSALTSDATPGDKTGTAFGIVFGVMSLGGSAATPIIGYVADHYTLQLGFVLLAVFFLGHGLLMQLVKPRD